jgi:hypothetical protein
MKHLARRSHAIEYLSESRSTPRSPAEPDKRSWLRRHPLAAGIIVATMAGGCWLLSCGDGEEKRERAAVKAHDSAREMRKQKMRGELQQLRTMIRLQKNIREKRQEFEQKEKEDDDRMLKEFSERLDAADEEELDDMLSEQNRAIEELGGEDDTDKGIELARIKRGMVKEKQYLLDMEEEIREEGLLDKTTAELETLKREQEDIIATEQFYASDQYMNALMVVDLIDKAMQIKWLTGDKGA